MKIDRYVARRQWMKQRKEVIRKDNKGREYTVYEPSWREFKEAYLTENPRSVNKM